MLSRISIRGCVRPPVRRSVRPSVRRSIRRSVHPSVRHTPCKRAVFDQNYYSLTPVERLSRDRANLCLQAGLPWRRNFSFHCFMILLWVLFYTEYSLGQIISVHTDKTMSLWQRNHHLSLTMLSLLLVVAEAHCSHIRLWICEKSKSLTFFFLHLKTAIIKNALSSSSKFLDVAFLYSSHSGFQW